MFQDLVFPLLLMPHSWSLTCNSYTWSGEAIDPNATCFGDTCVSYYSTGEIYSMGCASNIFFPSSTGCFGNSDFAICACTTERCNNNTLYIEMEFQQPSCFTDSRNCTGLTCRVQSTEYGDTESCVDAVPFQHFIEMMANVIAFEQTSRDVLIDKQIDYYLTTEFHSGCINNICMEHARNFRKVGIISTKPQVECHTYFQDYKHNITCKGDFCYYQFNGGAVSRGCYTVDDSLATRNLTAGFYQFFDIYVLLCDEDLCNDNIQQFHNISDAFNAMQEHSVCGNVWFI